MVNFCAAPLQKLMVAAKQVLVDCGDVSLARLPFLPSKLVSHIGAYGTSFTEPGITQYAFFSVTVMESLMCTPDSTAHRRMPHVSSFRQALPCNHNARMIFPLSSATAHSSYSSNGSPTHTYERAVIFLLNVAGLNSFLQ